MNSNNPMLVKKKTSEMNRCNLSLVDEPLYSVVVSVVSVVSVVTTVCSTLPLSAIFRGNVKTLSLPKMDLSIHSLSFRWDKWTNKCVIYISTITEAIWAYYVFPPCLKCMWFKLALNKVFPVLFLCIYH